MPNPNPSPATRFKPGVATNPEGKKGPRLKERLERSCDALCKTKAGKEMTRADALVEVLWDLAINKKDLDAVKFIFERVEGKMTKYIHMEGPQTVRVAFDEEVIAAGLGPNSRSGRVTWNGVTDAKSQPGPKDDGDSNGHSRYRLR